MFILNLLCCGKTRPRNNNSENNNQRTSYFDSQSKVSKTPPISLSLYLSPPQDNEKFIEELMQLTANNLYKRCDNDYNSAMIMVKTKVLREKLWTPPTNDINNLSEESIKLNRTLSISTSYYNHCVQNNGEYFVKILKRYPETYMFFLQDLELRSQYTIEQLKYIEDTVNNVLPTIMQ